MKRYGVAAAVAAAVGWTLLVGAFAPPGQARTLDEVEAERGAALDELRVIERSVEKGAAELRQAEASAATAADDAAAAETAAEQAAEQLAEGEVRLQQAERLLGDARRRHRALQGLLDEAAGRLGQTAAAVYRQGPTPPPWVALAVAATPAEGLHELHRADRFLQAAATEAQAQRQEVADLTVAAEAAAEKAVMARDEHRQAGEQLAAAAAEAEQAADDAARTLADAEIYAAEVAALQEGYRSDEARYRQLAADLQAESDAIAARLRETDPPPEVAPEPPPEAGPEPPPAGPPPPADGAAMVRPVAGPITSPYGWRQHPILGVPRLHAGVDFGAPTGTPIHAAAAGQVVSAGAMGGYGLTVVIDHGGGMATLYAHQSSLAVAAGQQVAQGQQVGAVGSTGVSTAPHLHFEVRLGGNPVDPMGYLP